MILLDTHAWLWLGSNPARLSRTAAAAISGAVRSGGIAVASVSLVEIAWLMAHNRLGLRGTSETVLTRLVDLARLGAADLTVQEFADQGQTEVSAGQYHPPYNSNPPTSGWKQVEFLGHFRI